MKPEERRRALGRFRSVIFFSALGSLAFSVWVMKDTNPGFFDRVLEETVKWGWSGWLVASALAVSCVGLASWFAPKIYCDYVDSLEHERAAAVQREVNGARGEP